LIRIDHHVPISDGSSVASARRQAVESATRLRLSETASARAALIATELATNLVKHGGGGSFLCGASSGDDRSLYLIAVDSGRGLVNLAAAMEDGFSTAGSPGTGLGAISRSATSIDVYALAGRGTAVLAIVSEPQTERPLALQQSRRVMVAGIGVAKRGEEQSGDAWTATVNRDQLTLCVADGLGHGPGAATASNAAIRAIGARPEDPLEQLLRDAHTALRPTRGAAIGLARIDLSARRVDFAGVGNIAGAIVDEAGTRRVVSLNGIVGHEMRKVQSFSYPWTSSASLVMQSDGVSASWNASSYPGLMQHDPALVAAVIFRDHCRGNDDATVVVARAD
jgi:anti-sigma regulatory factor (Ser/Thr protein kinase)